MTTYKTDAEERTDLDDRDRRALEQYLTVLPDYDRAKGADDLFMIVSQSGEEYLCDLKTESCECPDAEYRNPEGGCKHVRRARYAVLGVLESIPSDVDVDPNLGEHVSCEIDDSNNSSERAVATDGGVAVRETVDDAEILEDDESDPWEGPFPEYDKYGGLTGCSYVRCRDCGREVLTGRKEFASHQDGCRFGGDN